MTEEQALEYVKAASEKALADFPKQHSVHFKLKEKTSSVLESKIGGMPYLPVGCEIPLDSNGKQLRFLMQINCSEVPKMECFPEKGMIQFWIAADDCWGMYDNFKVVYHNEITEEQADLKITEFLDYEKEFFPLHGEFGVEFFEVYESISKNSLEYEKAFCKYFNELSGENIKCTYDLQSKLKVSYNVYDEACYSNNSAYGHKIGGNSDFCQYDPRETEEAMERYNFQLLQMQSDFGRIDGKDFTNIMWGDAGICHFFINSEKLRNCDFSDILYYCDCC